MISPWLNMTVKVQRRGDPQLIGTNVLNEPSYGTDPNLPVAYASVDTRIEYDSYELLYTETGERVNPGGGTWMIVEPEIILKSQDRVTVLTSDDPEVVGKVYIIKEVYSEWNTVGNVHHYIASLQVH